MNEDAMKNMPVGDWPVTTPIDDWEEFSYEFKDAFDS